MSVKSSVVTKEEVTVARGGKIVDERSRETKENNFYTSSTSEIWEPVGIIHNHRNLKPFDSSDESRPNSNASSDQGYTTNSSSHVLRERGGALAGCPICEDNDPDCRQHCIRGLGLTGSSTPKVPGVQTTTSAVSRRSLEARFFNPNNSEDYPFSFFFFSFIFIKVCDKLDSRIDVTSLEMKLVSRLDTEERGSFNSV